MGIQITLRNVEPTPAQLRSHRLNLMVSSTANEQAAQKLRHSHPVRAGNHQRLADQQAAAARRLTHRI